MNKILLILTLSSCSYGLISHESKDPRNETSSLLGAGQLECGQVVEAADKGLDSDGYFYYLMYAQGVISTLNFTQRYIYEEKRNFAPSIPTLKRLMKKHCEENLTINFFSSISAFWVENAK